MVYSNAFVVLIASTLILTSSCENPCQLENDHRHYKMMCINTTINFDNFEERPEIQNINLTDVTILTLEKSQGDIDLNKLQHFTNLEVLLVVEGNFSTFKLKSNVLKTFVMVRTTVSEEFSFADCCSKLERLQLKSNKGINMKTQPFRDLGRLRHLALSLQDMKKITRDTFKGLSKLKTISIINCSLESIEEGSFDDLHNLRDLYIEDNNLRYIDQNIFEPLKELNSLSMYGKSLPPLPISMFGNQKKLMEIGLPLNTWRSLDVEKIPDTLPQLNFFSYIGEWRSTEDKENIRRIFKKLKKLLIN